MARQPALQREIMHRNITRLDVRLRENDSNSYPIVLLNQAMKEAPVPSVIRE